MRERKRAALCACVCVEKNQLLFTTLQAARGKSAGTEGGANIHRERERESDTRERKRHSRTTVGESEPV